MDTSTRVPSASGPTPGGIAATISSTATCVSASAISARCLVLPGPPPPVPLSHLTYANFASCPIAFINPAQYPSNAVERQQMSCGAFNDQDIEEAFTFLEESGLPMFDAREVRRSFGAWKHTGRLRFHCP